ncbi:Uncharacterised protein [uncultured archaeon]|nr:Uncharacterised protein [uncultured archaeon]
MKFRCERPGTAKSHCVKEKTQEQIDYCGPFDTCIQGECIDNDRLYKDVCLRKDCCSTDPDKYCEDKPLTEMKFFKTF